MYPFWVEVSWEELLQVAMFGITAVACLVQTLLFSR